MSRSAGSGSFLSPNYYQKPEGIYHRDGKVTRLTAGNLESAPRQEGRFRYVGSDDHYFLSVALLGEKAARVDYHVTRLALPQDPTEFVRYDLALPRRSPR